MNSACSKDNGIMPQKDTAINKCEWRYKRHIILSDKYC